MRRGDYSPLQFGIDLTRERLMDLFVEEFNIYFRDQMTVDELVLNPSVAIKFCDEVRHKHGFYHLPDDIILRSLMTMRKRG